MNKVTSLALVGILIVLMSASCTRQVSDNKGVSNGSVIPDSSKTVSHTTDNLQNTSKKEFEYFFRGFVDVKTDELESYPHQSYVIETDGDWHDFMNKYVPGIYYRTTVDYTKECLVFCPTFSPHAMFGYGSDIRTLVVDDENNLAPLYIKNGPMDEIYAMNDANIVHCFVNIVKMNKNDVPEGVKNVYHRK
jgi:hypothetical protein